MKKAFVNAMVTALEGGSNYWCEEVGFYDAKGKHISMDDWFDNGAIIRVYDGSAISSESRVAFFQTVNRLFPDWEEVFSDEGDYDADDADQFLQFGVFGEVIFG